MTNGPKKSLGQHWLKDASILEAITNCAEVGSEDTVLEIGPGLGTLTAVIARKAKHVVAVEFDRDLAQQLQQTPPASNVEVLQGDIRTFDLNRLPADYKVVANIPYYLTSHLIRILTDAPNQPNVAVLLIQKEVAQRVAASPGAMSLLSAITQLYWDVSLGPEVPAHLFTPPPKVDSQVLILKRLKEPRYSDIDYSNLTQIIKAGFSAPRKTLLNALSAGLRQDKTTTTQALEQAGIDQRARAQTLRLDDWVVLSAHLKA